MRTARILALAALCLAIAAPAAAEKVKLEQKYPPGTYTTTLKQSGDMTVIVNAGGQERTQAQKMEMLMVSEMVVSEPDDQGVQTLSVSYERIRQVMQMAGQKLIYDSQKPDASHPMLAQSLKPLLDAKLKITLGKDGEVKEVKGMEDLWDKMVQKNPRMAPMVEKMKEQFGDRMIKQLIGQANKVLPEKPVGVGDTWKSKMDAAVPVIGTMKITQNCRLKEISKVDGAEIAHIAIKGKVKNNEPTQMQVQGVNMTVQSMDLDQEGAMQFNASSGMLQEQSVRQKGTIKMSIQTPQGQNVTTQTEMDTVTDVKVEKKK